jgi:DeoR/GlpR family transcriptional regulator of sugar metabolism
MQREVTVEELAVQFATSPITIRRDLDSLAEAGMILRTYGGCIIRTELSTMFQQQLGRNFRLKQAIGCSAAEQIRSGETILFDDGSTTFHLASNLESKAPLTVVTNSIAAIPEISRFHGVQLEILGGAYNRETNFLGGSLAERLLEMRYFDAVFVGVDAVDEAGQCMVNSPDVARLTQVMLRRANRRFLLADHTKVGAQATVVYGRLSDFDMWITTRGMAEVQLDRYGKMTTVKEAIQENAMSDERGTKARQTAAKSDKGNAH